MTQLYLGAFHLAQVVSSRLKVAERLATGEAITKNFGLAPMARRSLQWEIAKVGDAQVRAQRRAKTCATAREQPPSHRPDPRLAVDADNEDNPFTRKRLEREAARR